MEEEKFEFSTELHASKKVEGYDNAFELRDEAGSIISSQLIEIYPKFMLVNKTGLEIIGGGKGKDLFWAGPFSERYFSSKDKT